MEEGSRLIAPRRHAGRMVVALHPSADTSGNLTNQYGQLDMLRYIGSCLAEDWMRCWNPAGLVSWTVVCRDISLAVDADGGDHPIILDCFPARHALPLKLRTWNKFLRVCEVSIQVTVEEIHDVAQVGGSEVSATDRVLIVSI